MSWYFCYWEKRIWLWHLTCYMFIKQKSDSTSIFIGLQICFATPKKHISKTIFSFSRQATENTPDQHPSFVRKRIRPDNIQLASPTHDEVGHLLLQPDLLHLSLQPDPQVCQIFPDQVVQLDRVFHVQTDWDTDGSTVDARQIDLGRDDGADQGAVSNDHYSHQDRGASVEACAEAWEWHK